MLRILMFSLLMLIPCARAQTLPDFEARLRDSQWIEEYFSQLHGTYGDHVVDSAFEENVRTAAEVFYFHFSEAHRLIHALPQTHEDGLTGLRSSSFSYLRNHFDMMNAAFNFVVRSGLEDRFEPLVHDLIVKKAKARSSSRSLNALIGSAALVGVHAGFLGFSALYAAPLYLGVGLFYAIRKIKKPEAAYEPSQKQLATANQQVLEKRFGKSWKIFFDRLVVLENSFWPVNEISRSQSIEDRILQLSRFLRADLKVDALIEAGLLPRSSCEMLLLP